MEAERSKRSKVKGHILELIWGQNQEWFGCKCKGARCKGEATGLQLWPLVVSDGKHFKFK